MARQLREWVAHTPKRTLRLDTTDGTRFVTVDKSGMVRMFYTRVGDDQVEDLIVSTDDLAGLIVDLDTILRRAFQHFGTEWGT